MSKDLLLEIGTEEVPAHAMPGILAELKANVLRAFPQDFLAQSRQLLEPLHYS